MFALAQERAAELFWIVHADVYFHLLTKLWRNDGGFYFKHPSGCCGARAIHQPNTDTRSANGHYGVHLLINTSRSGAVYAHLLCRPAATYGYFKRFKLAVFANSLYVGLAFIARGNLKDASLGVPFGVEYAVGVVYGEAGEVAAACKTNKLALVAWIKADFGATTLIFSLRRKSPERTVA